MLKEKEKTKEKMYNSRQKEKKKSIEKKKRRKIEENFAIDTIEASKKLN